MRLILFPLPLKYFCEDRQQGIEKDRSVHHPDFHDLHREGIEGNHAVRDMRWFHDREEYGIHLEKYHIQKECESVGKGSEEDMSDIGGIPAKTYRMPPIRIPPRQCGHDEIPCESCDHDEGEAIGMSDPPCESCEHEDHPKRKELPYSIRDDREFSFEYWLEIAHEWAIDESEKREYRGNRDTDKCLFRVVSTQKISDRKGEKNDETSWESSQCEDIRTDFFDHLRIIGIRGELSHGDRIESEIRDHSKYREVVVDLRIEAISFDIEIASEDLDHADRYDSSEDFSSDLSKGISIDFSGRHEGIIEKRSEESKGDIFSLEKS